MWVCKDPNRSGLGMWGPGVAPNGDKTDEMLPMNPEGDEVDAVSYTHLTLPTILLV